YFRRFAQIMIALSFFMPLIVVPSSFIFPFIVPKVIAFRALTALALGSYLLLLVSNWERYKPKISWIHVGVFLFILSFMISTFTGVDPFRSFWDNHERMLGLFSVMHYVLFYYIVSSVVTKWNEWRWISRTALFGGVIVMFIAFLQKFVDPQLVLNQGGSSVHSTLGNPIYVGGYGGFLIFLGLLMYTKDKNIHKYWRYFYLFSAFSGLFGLYAAGQRGPLLGLVAGTAIAVYVYAYIFDEKKNVRRFAIYGTIAGLVLVGTLFYFRKTNFVRSIPIVGQTMNINPDKGSLETRLIAWDIAYKSWKDRPVFGWGPRNYYYAFNQYYNPEILSHGFGETWFDNAHNILMETISTRGAFGFLTYIALFLFAFIAIFKGYNRGDINAHEAALASGFLVGHFVHNLLVFEDPTSYLYFMFALAYINQRVSRGENRETTTKKGRLSYGVAGVIALATVIFAYSTNINPLKANMNSFKTLREVKTAGAGMSTYQETLDIPSPHRDVIVTDIANAVLKVLPKYKKAKKMDQIVPLFNKVYKDTQEVAELHPRDIRVHMKLYRLNRQKAALEQDKKYIKRAEKNLETALKYSPKRQQLLYMMANLKMQLGQSKEAEKLLISAKNSDKDISESWWRLALFYQKTNQPQKARNTIIRAKREGVEFNGRGGKVLKQVGLDTDKISATSSIKTSTGKQLIDIKKKIKKQINKSKKQ
ncbi:MAG: O-antigen ligase family protein, partial [Candidatus Magasanikbacteria bacterium]